MALTSAIAFGPIAYVADGLQVFIPIPAFGFNDSTGVIEFVVPDSYSDLALAWLNQLRQWGYIRPSTRPARRPAMVINAVDPGVWGNQIAITFTSSGGTFDMEVEATTSYAGVSLSTLKTLLGTETQPGTQPGLVRFLNSDLPLSAPAAIADVAFTGGIDNADVPIPATTGILIKTASDSELTAFTLVARKPGVRGTNLSVTIAVDSGLYNVTVKWSRTTTGLTAGGLSMINTEFGYMISVSAPPDLTFAIPEEGTITLAGGTAAAKASARPITP